MYEAYYKEMNPEKRMKILNEMLSEEMKNDEFRKEYEAIQPELDIIRAMVDARNSRISQL